MILSIISTFKKAINHKNRNFANTQKFYRTAIIFNLNLITAFEVVVETSSDKNFLLLFNSDKREEVELEKGLS